MNLLPLSSAWPAALGWTVLHSIWQGTALAALLAIFLAFTRKQPNLRYLGAVTTLSVWLLATIITFAWYVREITPETSATVLPALFPGQLDWRPADPGWWLQLTNWLGAQAPWVGMAWCFGSFLVLTRWIGGRWYLQRIRQHFAVEAGGQWQRQLRQMAGKMGMNRTVTLMESARVFAPILVGSLRPVILLPAGLLTGMDPRQIEAILAHELAHLRRWDDVINLLLALMEGFWFFHPAYWWIAGRVRQERELCCDDMAVGVCGDPLLYARTLASLEASRGFLPSAALSIKGNEGLLFQRIKRIMMPNTTSPYQLPPFLPAGLAVMAVLILGWVSPEAKAEPVSSPSLLLGPISGSEGLLEWSEDHEPGHWPVLTNTSGEAAEELQPDWQVTAIGRPDDWFSWSIFAAQDSPLPAPPAPPVWPGQPVPPAPPAPPLPAFPALPPVPPAPPAPAPPAVWTEESRADYEAAMERWGQQMEQSWGPQMEAWGRQMEVWGQQMGQSGEWERWSAEMEAWGEALGAQMSEEQREAMEARIEAEMERMEAYQEEAMARQEAEMERAMRHQAEAIRRQEEAMQRSMERADRVYSSNTSVQALKNELVRDGLMNGNDDRIRVKVDAESIKINGQSLDESQHYRKYRNLLGHYGVSFCEGCSSNLVLTVD